MENASSPRRRSLNRKTELILCLRTIQGSTRIIIPLRLRLRSGTRFFHAPKSAKSKNRGSSLFTNDSKIHADNYLLSDFVSDPEHASSPRQSLRNRKNRACRCLQTIQISTRMIGTPRITVDTAEIGRTPLTIPLARFPKSSCHFLVYFRSFTPLKSPGDIYQQTTPGDTRSLGTGRIISCKNGLGEEWPGHDRRNELLVRLHNSRHGGARTREICRKIGVRSACALSKPGENLVRA